jgi:hypothetical protein
MGGRLGGHVIAARQADAYMLGEFERSSILARPTDGPGGAKARGVQWGDRPS